MRLWGVLFMVFVCLSSPAFGSIVGDTITVAWYYPDLSTQFNVNAYCFCSAPYAIIN